MYTYTYAYTYMHKYISSGIIAVAYDMFGIFCGICRKQSMATRFYYSDSCTCERQEVTQNRHHDTKRDNKKDRQTNTSIGICLTLSRSFRSMLNQVSHALELLKRAFC